MSKVYHNEYISTKIVHVVTNIVHLIELYYKK